MTPLHPTEVAERIAAERTQRRKQQAKVNVQRRRDAEFERDLREMGFDVRRGVEL